MSAHFKPKCSIFYRIKLGKYVFWNLSCRVKKLFATLRTVKSHFVTSLLRDELTLGHNLATKSTQHWKWPLVAFKGGQDESHLDHSNSVSFSGMIPYELPFETFQFDWILFVDKSRHRDTIPWHKVPPVYHQVPRVRSSVLKWNYLSRLGRL